jgi:hypothetical protein
MTKSPDITACMLPSAAKRITGARHRTCCHRTINWTHTVVLASLQTWPTVDTQAVHTIATNQSNTACVRHVLERVDRRVGQAQLPDMEQDQAMNKTLAHIAAHFPKDLVAQSLEHLVLLQAVDTWPNGECEKVSSRIHMLVPHQTTSTILTDPRHNAFAAGSHCKAVARHLDGFNCTWPVTI